MFVAVRRRVIAAPLATGLVVGACAIAAGLAAGEIAKSEVASFSDAQFEALVQAPDRCAKTDARCPLVIWLHDYSQRGSDPAALMREGLPAIAADRDDLPGILVSPQLEPGRGGWDPRALDRLIAEAQERYAPSGISLAGHRGGVAGIFDLLARSEHRFDRILILSGLGSTAQAAAARGLDVRIHSGAADPLVTPGSVQRFKMALDRAGAHVQLVLHEDVGSDSAAITQAALASGDTFDWIFGATPEQQAVPGVVSAPMRGPDPRALTRMDLLKRDQLSTRIFREARDIQDQLADRAPLPDLPDEATIFAWIEALTVLPHRRPGTPEAAAAAEYIAAELQRLGIGEVRRHDVTVPVWLPGDASLTLEGQTIAASVATNASFTGPEGLGAALVYAETGDAAAFRRIDARGKIVVIEAVVPDPKPFDVTETIVSYDPLAHAARGQQSATVAVNLSGALPAEWMQAGGPQSTPDPASDIWRNAKAAGAVGLVIIVPAKCGAHVSMYWPFDGAAKALPAIYLADSRADPVRLAAQRGRTATLTATGTLDAGTATSVLGTLPGATSEEIILASHYDAVASGAVADASGVAMLLAQAAAWSSVPQAERPRGLVFAVTGARYVGGGAGVLALADARAKLLKETRAVVTVEAVAAREVHRTALGDLPTTMPQASTINIPNAPDLAAILMRSLTRAPQPSMSVELPANGIPLSDAFAWQLAAAKVERQIPYVSWSSQPCYRFDAGDTLEMVDRSRLVASADTVREIVRGLMEN